MEIIDIGNWDRKKSYQWFSSFRDTTYNVSAKIDVTPLVNFIKSRGLRFYEHMLYLTVRALNAVPDMRLRIRGNDVVRYDAPRPSFTVAKDDGTFDICLTPYDSDPEIFTANVRRGIDGVRASAVGNKELGDPDPCVYYFTCLPWLDFTSMNDPIPDDKVSQSIPRICWGKYVLNGVRYEMNLNITVSHALVDGRQLCTAFEEIQKAVNDCEKIFKREIK